MRVEVEVTCRLQDGVCAGWLPGDPSEVGTVSVTGNQVTFVPETSQPQGATHSTATFELFRTPGTGSSDKPLPGLVTTLRPQPAAR